MTKLFEGDLLKERYTLQTFLSEGRSNEYWIAIDTLLEREVRIQYLHLEVDESKTKLDINQAFLDSARILAKLEHPNIVPVYDLGFHNGKPFAVTRFNHYQQAAEPLISIIRANIWTPIHIISFAQKFSSVIDFIHERGVFHTDLNAGNILIDAENEPFITNFYMAGLELQDQVNIIYPRRQGYSAPEIKNSKKRNAKSDLYSFGVILLHLFLGDKVFQKAVKSDENNIWNGLSQEGLSQLSAQYRLILERLTRAEASERPDSAHEAYRYLLSAFRSHTDVKGKIFISYSRSDRNRYRVYDLVRELRRLELDVWIDQDIESGSNWDDSIKNKLDECDMMLLITTEASLQSEYVTHEWSYFMGRGKPVYSYIPQTDSILDMHPVLRRIQYIEGTDDMLVNVWRIIQALSGDAPTKINIR